jgi:chromosome segregation ATPase
LKEAQIRDNLADIRIAGAEGDWKSRVEELVANLTEQQEETSRMRANYEQEITLLKETHASEIASLHHDKAKSEDRALAASDKCSAVEACVTELLATIESEKASAKAQIQKMQEEMDNSEQARDEIKQRLAQARDMVAAAEHDWMDKNSALEKV